MKASTICAGVRLKFIAALLLGVSATAYAHKIEPGSDVDIHAVKAKHQKWFNQWAAPVHEEMAVLADYCASHLGDEDFCPNKQSLNPNQNYSFSDALIWGIRWNDDPNNQTAGGKPLNWLFWLSDASKKA